MSGHDALSSIADELAMAKPAATVSADVTCIIRIGDASYLSKIKRRGTCSRDIKAVVLG